MIGRPLFCTDSDSSNNYGLVGIGFQEKISDIKNGVKSFLKGHSYIRGRLPSIINTYTKPSLVPPKGI